MPIRSATGFTRWDPLRFPGAIQSNRSPPPWDRRLVLVNIDIVARRANAAEEGDEAAGEVQRVEGAARAAASALASFGAVVVVPSCKPEELGPWASQALRPLVPAKMVHTQADLAPGALEPLKDSEVRGLVLCPTERLDLAPILEEMAIHLVVFDGPTGMNAWPIHPQWVRATRDACADARVPFSFTGWGAYAFASREFDTFASWVNKGRSWLSDGAFCLDTKGRILEDGANFMQADREGAFPVAIGYCLGSGAHLGRTIDGEEHLEIPEMPRSRS